MAETTGMESALFTALILAAVACAISRRDLGAVSFAALAALVRPEGFVLLLLCQLYVFVRDQKRGVSLVLVSVVILAPWFVFATWYFGSPLPSSIGGKLALYAAPGQSGMLERLSYVLALHSPVGSIITLLAVIGSILIVRHRFEFGVVLAFAFALVAGYTIAPTHIFFWYVAPIQPVIILTALACVHFTSRSLKLAESRAAAAAAALATVALATWGNFSMFESARWQQAQQEAIHLQLGLYLKGRVPDGAVVAAEDIGYIGYYSKCRILDRDGLVSPEVQQFNRDGRYYGVIEQFRPEWLVADTSSPISGFLAEVDFMRGYAIDTSIGHSGRAYHVFRRRN